MKTLWIQKNFPPSVGGVQKNTYNTVMNMKPGSAIVLTKELNLEGTSIIDNMLLEHQQKVHRTKLIPDDLGLVNIFKHPFYIPKFCYCIYQIIRVECVDLIIFAHNTFFFLFSLYFLKSILKTPIAIYFRGEDIPTIKMKSNNLMSVLINKADFYLCNSNFTLSRLEKFIGMIDKNVIVSYPGAEDKYFMKPGNFVLQDKININDKQIIYTVGRLDKRKGHDTVIKALSKIIKKYPNIIYLIAGDGPYKEKLERDIEKYGLQENVYLLGLIPDEQIVALHHLGDIFLMPNRTLEDGDTEGFGAVFVEANACCNPTIGGRSGGAVEAIEDNVTGFIVDPYQIDELVEKLVFLLNHEERAKSMGMAGRDRAYEKFSWSILAARLEKKIEQAVMQIHK